MNMATSVPNSPLPRLVPLPLSGGNPAHPQHMASGENGDGQSPYSPRPSLDTCQISQGENSYASRRGRKGHSKSRTGCYNCKKARIKCKENRPSCEYCSLRDFKCVWPDLQTRQFRRDDRPVQDTTLTRITPSVPSGGPSFTAQDFRLFNHFIQTAYPHVPRDDSVWTHEVPSIASDHDFLLYSMLALSLSHLAAAQPSSPQLKFAAMGHRVKAISSLNEAIGRPIESLEQANAMIATCFSLSVQSTVLEDGLVDFMMFLRGVVAISIYMRQKGFKFLFHHMFDLTEAVASELSGSVLTNSSYARGVCRSLELLHPLVQSTTEVECHRLLLSAAKALFTSSREAYISLSEVYSLFSYHMSQEEFSHFINPSNEVGKLLQTHFVALRLIMTPIISKESFGRKVSTVVEADKTMSQWLGTLVKDVKPDMKKYFEWPIWLHSEVVAGRLALGYEAIRHDSAHSSTFM